MYFVYVVMCIWWFWCRQKSFVECMTAISQMNEFCRTYQKFMSHTCTHMCVTHMFTLVCETHVHTCVLHTCTHMCVTHMYTQLQLICTVQIFLLPTPFVWFPPFCCTHTSEWVMSHKGLKWQIHVEQNFRMEKKFWRGKQILN